MWRTLSQQHPGELSTLGSLAVLIGFDQVHACLSKTSESSQ
jgi:hypothetical protein